MKNFILIVLAASFSKCSTNQKEQNVLGNDVRLFKNTPVWEVAQAIEKEDTINIKQLLQGKSENLLNYREKTFGQSLLRWAVYTNHYPSVKVLAELGADPNLKSNDSTSAFIQAANKFTSEYLKLLLNYGGNVNAVADLDAPQHLRTPLMAAAFKNLENVKILINAGANANYEHSSHGIQNALLYAFYGDKIEIVKYLVIDVGVDYKKALSATINGDSLYISDYLRGMTFPLESEEYKQKMEVVNYLNQRGIDYRKSPIPKHYYKNYDSAYLEKY